MATIAGVLVTESDYDELAGCPERERRLLFRPLMEVDRGAFIFFDCEDAQDSDVTWASDGHEGDGFYMHCTEYPDEGSHKLSFEFELGDVLELTDGTRSGLRMRVVAFGVMREPGRFEGCPWVVEYSLCQPDYKANHMETF